MNYHLVKSKQDFKFLSDLLTKKNYKFIETPRLTARQIEKKSQEPDRHDYILTLDNKMIGWFSLRLNQKQARFGIILSRYYQGKGYGKPALKLIEKEAKRLGVKELKLEVLKNNFRAVKLYRKSGFKERYQLIVMDKKI